MDAKDENSAVTYTADVTLGAQISDWGSWPGSCSQV